MHKLAKGFVAIVGAVLCVIGLVQLIPSRSARQTIFEKED